MPKSRNQNSTPDTPRSIKKSLGIIVGIGLGIWLLFFDSHSLLSRIKWYQEYRSLSSQNAQLEKDIARLEEQLEKGLSDEAVEKIAREEFGMRRDSETVYPVVEEND